jgi:hypothetical protein
MDFNEHRRTSWIFFASYYGLIATLITPIRRSPKTL